jgi:transcriptional regulator with XRE-family HTH domain
MFLTDLRKSKQLSVERVAADLGLSPTTVWRHERAARLNALQLRGYASYYGVDWRQIEQGQP